VAKPVIIKSQGNFIMCVLPAPYRIIFDALRDYLGTDDVQMATEEESRGLFPIARRGPSRPWQALRPADDHGQQSGKGRPHHFPGGFSRQKPYA